jgi:voltage-gated potassium channel
LDLAVASRGRIGGVVFLLVRFFRKGTLRHGIGLIAAAALITIAGGIAFAVADHTSAWIGLYWAVTTATTVGYGDVTPKTPAGHVIAVVVMLSTIPLLGAVFAIWSGAAAAARLRRLLHMGRSYPAGAFRLVVGTHPVVPAMLEELVHTGNDVVYVADVDTAGVRDDVHHVRGNPSDKHTLASAHPERAEHALVTGASDGDVIITAVLLREVAPELEMTALVSSKTAAEALHDLGIKETVSADNLVSHTLAKVLEAPHTGELLLELLDSESHRLDELELGAADAGRRLSAVRAERDDLVLGIVHDGKIEMGIGNDPTLAEGDLLLVARAMDSRRK